MKLIPIETQKREELIDITDQVRDLIKENNVEDGLCIVYTPHTTTAIAINETYDPNVQTDFISKLKDLVPLSDSYQHEEGNSDAHIKSSIIGNSRIILISGKRVLIGTWEGIFFCEFDGPRKRNVYVKIIKEI